jgi:hypothetical protein
MDASLQQLAGRLAVPSADRALGRVLDRFWSMGNRLTGGGVRAFATRMLAESLRRHPRLGGLASGELKPFPKPGTHVRQPSSPPKVVVPPNEGAEVTIDLAPDQSRLVEISFFGQQGRNVVRFETDGDRVKVESDPRDLFFNVRIVSSETRELIGRVKLLDGFSGLEIDGGLYHVWAIARRADLQIEEIPGEHKTAPYVFELSASSERSIKISRPAPDSVKFAPWDESVAASVIPASAQPVYRSLLAAMSDSNAWNQHR